MKIKPNKKIQNTIMNGTKRMENGVNDFQKELKDFAKTISAHFEGAVPEYGDFNPYFEFIPNKDKNINILKYGIKVFKMPTDIEPDPKMRYMEAAVYMPNGEYKIDMLVKNGNKEELKQFINSADFVKNLSETYQELIKNL